MCVAGLVLLREVSVGNYDFILLTELQRQLIVQYKQIEQPLSLLPTVPIVYPQIASGHRASEDIACSNVERLVKPIVGDVSGPPIPRMLRLAYRPRNLVRMYEWRKMPGKICKVII